MTSPIESFSTADLAMLIDVAPRHVPRLADAGIFERLSRGRWPASAVPAYVRWLRDGARQSTGDYAEERARLTRFKADLAEMELRVRRGELLERELVDEAVINTFTIVRSRFLAMPSKMAPRVARSTDPAICEDRIKSEVYAALRELAEPDLEEIAKQGVAA